MILVLSDKEWDLYRKDKVVTYFNSKQMSTSFGLSALRNAKVVLVEAASVKDAICLSKRLLTEEFKVNILFSTPQQMRFNFICVVVWSDRIQSESW